jgi:molecular chaperone GrpE
MPVEDPPRPVAPGRGAADPAASQNEVPDAPSPPAGDPATVEPIASPRAREPEEAPDWESRYRYLLAEFDNFRKRSARERETERREARGVALRALLPLYETFQRALQAAGRLPEADALRRGLELLQRDWDAFFAREGVVPVAHPGDRFRLEEHEAVGDAPADAAHPAGSVAEVVQQGYRFPGGLLRPAKVLVARAPAPSRSAESSSSEETEPTEDATEPAFE